jgi:glycosyltransferase involved in cell wall biosynthesis
MEKIKFSVSMCVYGKDDPAWFKTAVDSILEQTLKPDEVVLVVDGPVPQELDGVIRSYENVEGFKTVRLEVNRGHGDARRIGLENCQYEYVALMDADDISVPDRFEKQMAVISADPSLAVVGGNINEFIDNIENVVGSRVVPEKDADIKEYLRKRCPFNQVTVMFKKSAVEQAGGYIDWYCEEDYYLWLRLYLIDSKFANIPENLVNVRVGKEMYARRGGWKYFKSEAKLQKFMRQNRIIGLGRYLVNVTQRLIVQVLLPNKLRGWVFKKFAREKVEDGAKEV